VRTRNKTHEPNRDSHDSIIKCLTTNIYASMFHPKFSANEQFDYKNPSFSIEHNLKQ
jgi:hypothetical protein